MDFVLGQFAKIWNRKGETKSSLKRKLDELNCLKEDIDSIKPAELRPGKILKTQVQNWFRNVERINNEVQGLEQLTGSGDFLSLAEEVMRKTQEVEHLIQMGSFSDGVVIDNPLLPTAAVVGEATRQKMHQLLSLLMDEKITAIGIFGIGGVGKTTLLKETLNQLLKVNMFHTVIWVSLSKESGLSEVQNAIARQLHVVLPEEKDKARRIAKLSEIWATKGKCILILDDLWEKIPLIELGLPESKNDVKLVISTRSLDVCKHMNCQVVEVEPLPKEEAWNLFIHKVGKDIFNFPDLIPTAKQVAKECAGLPLALVTVANCMKGKLETSEWQNALVELQRNNESVFPIGSQLSLLLRFVYDQLEDVYTKQCFLSCSFYPEDHHIPKHELVKFWMNDGLLGETDSMQKMISRGHSIINRLVESCLLEETDNGSCLQMHNLSRDMAFQIIRFGHQYMSKAGMHLTKLPDEHEWTKDIEKVSLIGNDIRGIPPALQPPKCPALTTLLLSDNGILSIPESFFEELCSLKVLDLSFNPLMSLPGSISRLHNLKALSVCGCEYLVEVPSLSMLKSLKHLDLRLTNIVEVPPGIEMLKDLKYLDMSFIEKLQEIPYGVISSLARLQCLHVHNISSVATEIAELPSLEYFQGSFPDLYSFNRFVKSLSSQWKWLSNFHIHVGSIDKLDELKFVGFSVCKKIELHSLDVRGVNFVLPFDVEELHVSTCDTIKSLNDISYLDNVSALRTCNIWGCKGMECIFAAWCPPLHSIKHLVLARLPNLNGLLGGAAITAYALPSHAFSSLKRIEIVCCNKIDTLFSPCLVQSGLRSLEEILVEDCEQMEDLISESLAKADSGPLELTVPNLRKLKLRSLPRLRSICGENRAIRCDSLQKIQIGNCPKLKRIPLLLPLREDGQPSPPSSLQEIRITPKEYWHSVVWDHPYYRDLLLPFVKNKYHL